MGKDKGNDQKSAGSGRKAGKGKGSVEKDAGKKKANGLNLKIRHILCILRKTNSEKHARKEAAKAMLMEGVSFNRVAEQFSEDKAKQGGLLGIKTKGSLLSAFEEVAWKLEPSTTDKPIWGEAKTTEGYHIIMIEK